MVQTFKLRVPNHRLTPASGGSSIPEEWVEIRVDIDKLASVLGPKAVRSRRGVSRGLSGMVVVKHVRIKKA